MTAEPVTEPMLHSDGSRGLTIADVPRDVENLRYDLIEGSLTVTPLGDAEHQKLVTRLAAVLLTRVPEVLEVAAGVNVIDGVYTVLEPDVAVYDPTFLTEGGLGVRPEGLRFVIEVTSPTTWRRDLTIKRSLYGAWGVPYLVVDRRSDPHKLEVFGDLPDYAAGLLKAPPA
jgi:Uma2 family endonuclease